MVERGLTKPQIISTLTRSPHGALAEYLTVGGPAALQDPEFFAHLVAWNAREGQVRDAQVALPVIALSHAVTFKVEAELLDNALAHIAALRPREFVRALDFNREIKGPSRVMRRLVERYLRDLEADIRGAWEPTALQHRKTLKGLYAKYHIKPGVDENRVLFGKEALGRFKTLSMLATLTPEEIAGAIIGQKIPFLIARGALGKRAKEPDVLMALIKRMSPAELVNNMKMLERSGVKEIPALRAALEEGLSKVAKSDKRTSALKTSRAAEALSDDAQLSAKLKATQERQLDKIAIKGRWLVLGDMSGSMTVSLEAAKMVAALLARLVDETHLVFFNTSPRYFEVKKDTTYEDIKAATKMVRAGGGTSIGCGLQYLLDRKIEVDGIAIISDGGDNTSPYFEAAYKRYAEQMGIEPTVYLYRVAGEANVLSHRCEAAGIDVQNFDVPPNVDYYSLTNLVPTMRIARYALLDDIMNTPLRTLDSVLRRTAHGKGKEAEHVGATS